MYDVDGKILHSIKNIYVNSPACVKVKVSEIKCFGIDSGVRPG